MGTGSEEVLRVISCWEWIVTPELSSEDLLPLALLVTPWASWALSYPLDS